MQSDKLYVQGDHGANCNRDSFITSNATVVSFGKRKLGEKRFEIFEKKQLFYSHPNRTAFQLRARDSFYSAALLKFQNREAHI